MYPLVHNLYDTRRSQFHQHPNVFISFHISRRSQYSDQPTVWTIRGLIPGRGQILISLLQITPGSSGGRPTFSSMDNEILSLGSKRLGREFDQSPQSSADVKNEWNLASVPPNCIHAVDRKNLTLSCTSEGSNILWKKYLVQTNTLQETRKERYLVTGHGRKAVSVAASNKNTWRGSNP